MTAYLTPLVQSYGYYAVFVLIALESMEISLPVRPGSSPRRSTRGQPTKLNVVVLAAVAASAAIIGDNAGYWMRPDRQPAPG